MFCGKCGAKLEDGSVFCPNCGSRVGEEAGQAGQQAAGQPGPGAASGYSGSALQNEKKYRTIGIAAVAVVVVALLAIGISVWRANTGPKAVLNRFMQGIVDGKWEKALGATDLQIFVDEVDESDLQLLWNYGFAYSLDEEDAEEMKPRELREYVMEEIADSLEESMENSAYDDYDYKLKVKVLESEKLANYELRELEDNYVFQELGVEFKEARRLTARLTLSGDISEEEEGTFIMVKYGGKWYLSLIGSGMGW